MKKLNLLLLSVTLLYPIATNATPTLVPPPPAVPAQAYILQDFNSGQILMEKQADQHLEPASLTKLMTAYLVFEKLHAGLIHLTDQVKISEKAWRMPGSRTYVNVNTTVPLEILLKGMIIQSGNDATVTLAEFVAGSEETFVNLMNEQAQQLGLKNTHYTNSTGWPDEKQYSTARDLAKLAQTIINRFPEYYRWYSEKEFTYNNITQGNRNLLLWRDPTVDGMKTGYTESAGYCLVTSAKRGEMRLIAVLLGSSSHKTRATEGQAMLDYGYRFFETYKLYQARESINTEKVWQGSSNQLPLGLEASLYVTVPKGQYDHLKASMQINKHLTAPIMEGEAIGTLKINLGNETVLERPLIALSTIDKGNLLKKWVDQMFLLFNK